MSAWSILLPEEMYAQANESAENQDYKTAFAYYRQAALRGHIPSERCIGYMYLLGIGTKQNTDEALIWLNKAPTQEDSFVLLTLKLFYQFKGYNISTNEMKN